MIEKCYSLNNEDYNFATFDELYDAMESDERGAFVGREYWEAEAIHPAPSNQFSIDELIESLDRQAYELGGDYAEEWVFNNLTQEKVLELETMIKTFLDANMKCNFYEVKNIKSCKLNHNP
jgi:hypothetical protein